MSDQEIINRMDQILATSEDPRERHIAHRTAYYAHRNCAIRLLRIRISCFLLKTTN